MSPLSELQHLALNFLATFLVVTILNNNRRFLGPFIRPFTTNKVLSGPPFHRDRALFPGGFGGGLRGL